MNERNKKIWWFMISSICNQSYDKYIKLDKDELIWKNSFDLTSIKSVVFLFKFCKTVFGQCFLGLVHSMHKFIPLTTLFESLLQMTWKHIFFMLYFINILHREKVQIILSWRFILTFSSKNTFLKNLRFHFLFHF